MKLDRQLMLERFAARDSAYDGRFVTGVLTTGIYCLPSCPARRPKEENVRFFEKPQEAEARGLRPCKRCRPDLFYAGRDPVLERLLEVAAEARREPAVYPDVRSLAAEVGVGVTKLGTLFRRHFHVTPAAWLQRARVDEAARLLLDSRDGILDTAWAVGFESASAFHAAFRRHVGMSPSAYRGLAKRGPTELVVDLPAGFRREDTLRYLGRDPESPTERARGKSLVHSLLVEDRVARLEIELTRGRARCRVESVRALPPAVLAEVHRVVRRLLGLDCAPGPFERRLRALAGGRRLLGSRQGTRIPLTATPFEALVWAIVGQQVNLAFAYRLRRRLIELAGRRLDPWLCAHPTAAEVARVEAQDLTARQFSRRKAQVLLDVAARIAKGELAPEEWPEGAATVAAKRLEALSGVGPWTSQYVLMRGCGFADCLPVGDAGLVRALAAHFDLPERPGAEETRRLMAPFAPYRSLATYHFWKTLEPAAETPAREEDPR